MKWQHQQFGFGERGEGGLRTVHPNQTKLL